MADEYKKVILEKKAEAKRLMTNKQVKKCNFAIHMASAATAAEAFVPIPVVDAVPITATQVTMVLALGKVFDQKVSDSAARGLIGAAASTFIGRSLVKLIPAAGWAVASAVAAGVTEAIGWTVAVDFAKQSLMKESVEISGEFVKDGPTIISGDNENNSFSEQKSENDKSQELHENIIHTDTEAKYCENEPSESDQEDESLSNDFSIAFGEDE